MSDYEIPPSTRDLFKALSEALHVVSDDADVEATVRRVHAADPYAKEHDLDEVLTVVRLVLWPDIKRSRGMQA